MDLGIQPLGNGWYIERNPKPIPTRQFDYDFWHEDHDGTNRLCGVASGIVDALCQIKDIEE